MEGTWGPFVLEGEEASEEDGVPKGLETFGVMVSG